MPQHPATDTELIQRLNELVFEDVKFRSAVETAFVRARDELDLEGNTLPYSSAEILPTVFKSKLTERLRGRVNLCRVFILRKGQRMETPEIHRNTHAVVSARAANAKFSGPSGANKRICRVTWSLAFVQSAHLPRHSDPAHLMFGFWRHRR